jgi:hypothetical protein
MITKYKTLGSRKEAVLSALLSGESCDSQFPEAVTVSAWKGLYQNANKPMNQLTLEAGILMPHITYLYYS